MIGLDQICCTLDKSYKYGMLQNMYMVDTAHVLFKLNRGK